MTFKEYKGLDLTETGRQMLERWKRSRAFEKSLELREGAPEFIFFEGPPSANGMPGIHHVMARSIKDAICRYKTQTGFQGGPPGRLGHPRPARRTGRGKEAGYHQGGYRHQSIGRRIQRHLPQGGDEIYQRVGEHDRARRILGGYERPLHHLRQPLH